MAGGDVALIAQRLLNPQSLLRHGQGLVVLASIDSGHWPDRPSWRRGSRSSVAALAWSGVDSSVSQGWPPAFSTSASQCPMDSRRKGIAWVGAPQSVQDSAQLPNRQCQLKPGIELRGVAEALDEGLELRHRALRIALGKPRVGVLPFVVGGFLREALLGHRVLQPLHPGIAFAEAAGPFQIVAETYGPVPRRPGTADRPRPNGRRCGSSPPRGPGFPARHAIGSPSVPGPAPA